MDKKYRLIADYEEPDGSKSYGITVGLYASWLEAVEAKNLFRNAPWEEGQGCYYNFEIILPAEDYE